MTNIHHGRFDIERQFKHSVERVFQAWSHPEQKAIWFTGPPKHWELIDRQFDFREGGTEILHGRFQNGSESKFIARYHRIIENTCIIYVYDMYFADIFLSTTLCCVDFQAEHNACTIHYCEQGTYFGKANDINSRKHGTEAHFDRIHACLKGENYEWP